MPKYIITYDERTRTHDYKPLYKQLNDWQAAHLQNSVWLANLKGDAAEIRKLLLSHMHKDDTLAVLRLPDNDWEWATHNVRETGRIWLVTNFKG